MKPFDYLRNLSRVTKHEYRKRSGTSIDYDLDQYDQAVARIVDLGYTPAQAREATTRYLDAANETLGGPNLPHFLNMVEVVGLVPPPHPRP